MAKELPEKEKNIFVGVSWNCADVKFFITTLLFLCSLATVLQFLPSHLSLSFSLPSSALRDCTKNITALEAASLPSAPPVLRKQEDVVLDGGVIKRRFNAYGTAAYTFILMSAYRGGPHTFAINGLASKPLEVFGYLKYQCRWLSGGGEAEVVVDGVRHLPDWNYGQVYTVAVVNCTFPVPVGVDGTGGKLVLVVVDNGGRDSDLNETQTIEALTEAPGSLNLSYFTSPPKYDYLYCGSPLYGNLSPQRVREWIAYHVRFFGEKSHFIIHDAGGVHAEVLEVLRPWMDKGYVTLHDVREEERFDGYYHNQFLVVNDCLHRYRFDAKWMFFFDVDEFMFVPNKKTIKSATDSLLDYTQFTIEQMPMLGDSCLNDGGRTYREWGFEKLVYRDSRIRIRRDRKYAIQPRNVIATGVHMSEPKHVVGKTIHKTEGKIKYYHYHGTIAQRREPCRKLYNTTGFIFGKVPYALDTTMRDVAATVKKFELKMIGPSLQRTRQ